MPSKAVYDVFPWNQRLCMARESKRERESKKSVAKLKIQTFKLPAWRNTREQREATFSDAWMGIRDCCLFSLLCSAPHLTKKCRASLSSDLKNCRCLPLVGSFGWSFKKIAKLFSQELSQRTFLFWQRGENVKMLLHVFYFALCFSFSLFYLFMVSSFSSERTQTGLSKKSVSIAVRDGRVKERATHLKKRKILSFLEQQQEKSPKCTRPSKRHNNIETGGTQFCFYFF